MYYTKYTMNKRHEKSCLAKGFYAWFNSVSPSTFGFLTADGNRALLIKSNSKISSFQAFKLKCTTILR